MQCSTVRFPIGILPFTALINLSVVGFNTPAHTQIIPDATLGLESSVIESNFIHGLESDRIEGGAIRSNILFHSFSDFNVGEGRGAYFVNLDGITDILSRVTGENP